MSDHHFHRVGRPFLHLGPQNLHVGPPFSPGRPAVFASRAAKPACRTTIFTTRPDRLLFSYITILLFHFHWVPARGFCISGRKTCMSDHHFHHSAGPFTIFLPYYFTISFPLGSSQGVLHLGPQNLHVGPSFSPLGRAVYYSTISFPLGSSQGVLHLGPQNLHVGPSFSPVGRTVYYFTISFPLGSSQGVLHLSPQNLNVGPSFSPVGRTVYYFTISFPLGSRQEVFASRAAKPECRTSPRGVFASRTVFFACRLTFLHVGQTYPLTKRPPHLVATAI